MKRVLLIVASLLAFMGGVRAEITGMRTSPAGVSGDMQFNLKGNFGADTDLYYSTTTQTLHVQNITCPGCSFGATPGGSSGNIQYNNSGALGGGADINRTGTGALKLYNSLTIGNYQFPFTSTNADGFAVSYDGTNVDLNFYGGYSAFGSPQSSNYARIRAHETGTGGGTGNPFGQLQFFSDTNSQGLKLQMTFSGGHGSNVLASVVPDITTLGNGTQDSGFPTPIYNKQQLIFDGYSSDGLIEYQTYDDLFYSSSTWRFTKNVQVGGTLILPGLTSQGCIGTDGSGNVQAGSCSGGGGSGTTIMFQDGGSNVVASSTVNFNGAQFIGTNVSGVATFDLDASSVTLLGPSIALGSETTGVYVGSITVSSAFTLTGTNNVAGAAPIFSANSSSITLQGNTFNTGSGLVQLSGGVIPNSLIDGSSVTKQGLIVAGSNITLTPGAGTLTIAASASGSGDNLGNHIATMTLTELFGINASTMVLTSTGTQPTLSIVANGTYGTGTGTSGGFLIDCTGGGGASGMCAQFYTNASTQAALGGIVNIFQALGQNTWNEPGLYIKMASTNGGAANIRLDGPAPQIEWVETDQSSPAGKYEDGVNGDIRYIAGRKADNSGFDNFLEMARKDASGGGYVMLSSTQTPLRFHDAGTHYVSFRASDTVAANVAWVLPAADGSANQVWATNGAGNLFFLSVATGAFSPLTFSGGMIGVDSSSFTLLGPSIDLSGAEATGILAAARFPALTGDVTTSAGSLTTTVTDVDAATGLLSAAQKVGISTGGFSVGASTSVNFIAGTNMTITGAVNGNRIDLTFAASGSGSGDNLGNHVATMTLSALFGVNATTVQVTDDAYAAGWDGSNMVPTKNAVYDKIQSLSAGSGIVATDTPTVSGSWTWTNISTADFSGATNLLIPKSSDVSGKTALGSISIDSDDARMFVGTGSGVKAVISSVTFQVFTTTGTYTPNARMAFCKVYVTGTGGSADTCTATDCESGGGGAAGTAIAIFTAAQIGASQAVSIPAAPTSGNAGATTSFGSLLTSPTGGRGVNSGATTTVGANGAAGTGSTPTGGDINIKGGDATSGITYSTNFGQGGNGGASLWGGGGWGFTGASATGGVGNNGKAYGSGAGGCYAPDATDRNSGTGGGGIVIVQEFLN